MVFNLCCNCRFIKFLILINRTHTIRNTFDPSLGALALSVARLQFPQTALLQVAARNRDIHVLNDKENLFAT